MKWRIGDVTVTKIVEMEVTGGSRFILPQATYEEILPISWLHPHFADERGRLKMSIHALMVETPGAAASSSTPASATTRRAAASRPGTSCSGRFWPISPPPAIPRESIDTVLCTHLHVDHVGWNTMLVDGQMGPDLPQGALPDGPGRIRPLASQHERDDMAAVFADSVKPVHDAGLVDLVETDHRICDEISLIPTVGHTPGHVSVRIVSKGEEALITGDFMHHPCQIAQPEWSSAADSDPAQARHPRTMLAELAGTSGAGDRHAFRRRHRRPHRARRRHLPAGRVRIRGEW